MSKIISISLLLLSLLFAPINSFAFLSNFSSLYFDADYNKNSGKSQAAAKAKAQHGGKVLSVSEQKGSGQTVYKVKLLLDSGRIKIVKIKGK